MSASVPVRFLTAAQVKRLHLHHIAKALPTQPTLFNSAIDSPVNHEHYGQKDPFQLAAVLAEKIILDHTYQDGNKRTALFAADMFLKENGYRLQKNAMFKSSEAFDQALADAHVSVATREWTAEDLGKFYESIAYPLTSSSNGHTAKDR